jgi:YVTN family beta-propeller protein
VPARRLALLVATYSYQDAGLRQLAAPGHDAEALAEVLRDPEVADFVVTILINEPYYVVGNAIGEFYRNRCRDDLTLLYFTGHGLTNTKRDDLLFTALSAQQIDRSGRNTAVLTKTLQWKTCKPVAEPETEQHPRRKDTRWVTSAFLSSAWAGQNRSPIASQRCHSNPFGLSALTGGASGRQVAVAIGGVLVLGVLITVLFVTTGGSPPGPTTAPELAPTAGPEVAIPAVGASIAVGKTPTFVTLSPNGRYAYIASGVAGLITVVDTAADYATTTNPITDGPPQFLAFAPDGRMLYASIYNDQQTIHVLDAIDTASNTVIATIPQPLRPFLLAVMPDGKRLFVPNHDIASVSVVDTQTNSVLAQIKVAPNPHWVAFSRDSSEAYTAYSCSTCPRDAYGVDLLSIHGEVTGADLLAEQRAVSGGSA